MNSPADDLPLLSRLLDEALALEPERIGPWLAALPPERAALRGRLERMLALRSAPRHAGFLASGPRLDGVDDPAFDDGADDADDATPAPRAGDLIGPYRLIRGLGRGGMGAVWLAERADGSLKRQIALKLPRLAGGARLAEHMARERDIGALLEHPHIARLYDAGVDAHGRPWLALEHVDGQSLDAWCRSRSPSLTERLRLVLQIVRAVAYAHGRLVVHRDLKPSNVLVTPDGQAHLLDFGIARLLQVPGTPESADAARGTEAAALTPRYASPEQLRGEPVTVASDVYALGVLLFELLTGALPHEPVRLTRAALEAAVLGHDAPAASSRASDAATAAALRGELDAILAKALQRKPADRYATADAFADDLERHLAGERVLAMPDALGYRLAKTWQRHRVALVAAAAVLLAVLGGSGVALLQARRATEAAEQARLVKEFVIDIFKVSQHGRPADRELARLPVELLLERGAKLIESKHAGQPPLQAELYGVIGGIFAGMGANDPAAELATRQLEAQVALNAPSVQQAQATLLLAQALAAQGRMPEAQSMAQSALALAGADALLRPRARLLLAHVLLQQGQREAGVQALDAALREMEGQRSLAVDVARAKALRASLLVYEKRLDAARPLWQAAIAEAVAAEGALSPTAIDIRFAAAGTLAQQGWPDEARLHRDAALAALRASGGAGEVRAALEDAEASKALFQRGQLGFEAARAAIEADRALVVARGALVPARILATLDFQLGSLYIAAGDRGRGEPLIEASRAVLGTPARAASQNGAPLPSSTRNP